MNSVGVGSKQSKAKQAGIKFLKLNKTSGVFVFVLCEIHYESRGRDGM